MPSMKNLRRDIFATSSPLVPSCRRNTSETQLASVMALAPVITCDRELKHQTDDFAASLHRQ